MTPTEGENEAGETIVTKPATGLDPSQMMLDALSLHRTGRLEAATELYQQVLRRQPSHPEALRLLGVVHAQQGKLESAARLLRSSLSLSPAAAETHNNLGRVLHDLGRHEEAVAFYQKAISQRPDYRIALNNLGTAFAALGRHEEAAGQYRQALALEPGYAEALNNLGASLHALGRLEEAVEHLRAAVRQQPGFVDAEINLAKVFDALDRPREAIEHYQAAIAVQPANPQFHLGMATALHRAERYDEAEPRYRKVIEIAPTLARAHLSLGNLLLELGKLTEAVKSMERAIELDPMNLRSYLLLARAKTFSPGDAHLSAMLSLAPGIAALSALEQVDAHFAIGSALADVGQYDLSFEHILSGGRLKRSLVSYDENATIRRINRTRTVFSGKFIRSGRRLDTSSSLPVFIVGMPRSGSTLVEQVLASHRSIFGAGEISALRDAIRITGVKQPGSTFLASVHRWETRQLADLEAEYIRRLPAAASMVDPGDDVKRITDKMLENFRYVGLIHMAMPSARIIHIYRNPVDTCLSCFSIKFDKVAYSYDLGEVGRYYRAYSTLMRHWRSVLPQHAMLEIRYEDVVADLDCQARRMVAFCGLPWDDACLRFYEATRPIRTASVRQVRQPIYRNSLARWRPAEDTLRPLIEALGDESDLAV